MCPRCKAPETFVRNLRCAEGLVQEDHCSCGWSKARVLILAGMERAIKPSTEKDWRPYGLHDPGGSGSRGGQANYKKNGLTGVAKTKAGTAKPKRRKPYARQNPRRSREAMGYQHLGALDTFMIQPATMVTKQYSLPILDPSCS